jgi:hypothetical protein
MILVEFDTVVLGDPRHLDEQLTTPHSIRLAACTIKSSTLPEEARS